MTIFEDNSIELLPSIASGSGRAITPTSSYCRSKSTKLNNVGRSGSAPRSSSAPKGCTFAQAVNDAQNVGRLANSSRRKQRRWENDNLFGVRRYMRETLGTVDDSLLESTDDDLNNFGLRVCWKSGFAELLQEENSSIRLAFLLCKNEPQVHPNKSQSEVIFNADQCWEKVEKRLQSIVCRCIGNSELISFLRVIEMLLLHFRKNNSSPPPFDSKQPCLKGLELVFVNGKLSFCLPNSPFHRLLLHAACQFYGLSSKSSTINGNRVTEVKCTRLVLSSHQMNFSFVDYILSRMSCTTENSCGES